MKIINAALILICCFFSVQLVFGQDDSRGRSPWLFDEFEKTGCEDLWARLDYFANDLANEPDSTGYIFIHGDRNDLFENLHYESWVKGILESKNLKADRLRVIRSKAENRFYVEFWKFPAKPEAAKSIQKFIKERETMWSYVLPASTKPFIFHQYLAEDGLCPVASQVKLYADFLLANPEARGHLVIRDKNAGKFRREEAKALDELVNQYKVPRRRLKIFYQRDKSYQYDFTNVEFWYVPKKK